MTEKNLHRLTLNLEDGHKDKLDYIRKHTGKNVTEQIRAAISLYHYMLDAQLGDRVVRIIEPDGSYREVVIVL